MSISNFGLQSDDDFTYDKDPVTVNVYMRLIHNKNKNMYQDYVARLFKNVSP